MKVLVAASSSSRSCSGVLAQPLGLHVTSGAFDPCLGEAGVGLAAAAFEQRRQLWSI
ncbi:MAG: hypothetical protein U0271_48610 [Polyangiaceae bacterium]